MTNTPIIIWFRRDMRRADHQALDAAAKTGRPVIPVFILDPLTENIGAAPKWRLGLSVNHFAHDLESIGSRLVLRRGDAASVLSDLVRETGATSVYWTRWYEPEAVARDTDVKSRLTSQGVTAESFPGFLLFEPWSVQTGQGRPYSVYSPYWRNVSLRPVDAALPKVTRFPAPDSWPQSEKLDDWHLGAAMKRGADVVGKYVSVGEDRALAKLDAFSKDAIGPYKEDRNRPDVEGSSRLSENLTYGEISPRTIWHRGQRAMDEGHKGAEHFLKELVWREFAWHLMWYAPEMRTKNWRESWDVFPWDGDSPMAEAWRQARTGVDFVDAGLRELYVTGTMHNRVRMVVASYLTKHLRTDWRIGRAWFEETLIDWDPAANAMGWQWVAGCGPDAAPYFRVFNPDTQAEKFDPLANYRNRFLKESESGAEEFAAATPPDWDLSRPTQPIVSLKAGRDAALNAYEIMKS